MLSVDKQVAMRVQELRRQALESLILAQEIEDAQEEGTDILIMDGEEVVGFAFPQEEKV